MHVFNFNMVSECVNEFEKEKGKKEGKRSMDKLLAWPPHVKMNLEQ